MRPVRALVVVMLLVVGLALVACAPTRYDPALEATVVAKVMATISAQQTAAVPPTPTPVPPPTITPTPAPTDTPAATPTPPAEIEAAEMAIYAALVALNPINFDLSPSFALRQQTISGVSHLDFALGRDPDLPPDLEASYRSRNAKPYPIQNQLDIDMDHALMPESDWTYIFQGEGSAWQKLQERYPDVRGAAMFSRVGFSDAGDQALVEMGVRCGDLCGMGGLYWLEKNDAGWQIIDTLMVWES